MSVWLPRLGRRSAPAASRGERERVADPAHRGSDRRAAGRSSRGRRLDSASRCPARLPLSTDETYARLERRAGRACRTSCRGARGSARGAPCVASVASRRSTISSVPIQPKSRAVTVASRYSPMFVGEVRCATTGAGSSWKLSGGSAVVLRADEGLEEAPGPPGDQAEGRDVGRRELLARRLAAGGRLTQQRDERREQPQDDERRGDPATRAGCTPGRGRRRRPRSPRRPPSAGRSRAGSRSCRPWPAPRSSIRAGARRVT